VSSHTQQQTSIIMDLSVSLLLVMHDPDRGQQLSTGINLKRSSEQYPTWSNTVLSRIYNAQLSIKTDFTSNISKFYRSISNRDSGAYL